MLLYMKILFICTHNRCRSILAEAVTNHLAPNRFEARSAGSQPAGVVHPLTLNYLQEAEIATDGLRSESWDRHQQWAPDVVITVCDSAAEEPCPVWFGDAVKVHWGLADPSALAGSDEDIANAFRQTIQQLSTRINSLLKHDLANFSAEECRKLFSDLSGDPMTNTPAKPELPNVVAAHFQQPDHQQLQTRATHPPRILLLYGSLRKRAFSRLVIEESARLLASLGCETRIFNPSGLPLPDDEDDSHPKVQELRDLMTWSEGQVWCSPERHGSITGIMKAQIDWVPLSIGAVRPTQGKTLAVMQVEGGSQSFNAVNQLRVLGRWMRMITIPNQSSVAKAFLEFDDNDRMKPSGFYDRIVDVMEELVKFTLLTRDRADYLVDRYSERKESGEQLIERNNASRAD